MSPRLDRSRELQLRDVAPERVDFDLRVDGYYERPVSVVLGAGGRLRFPHPVSEAGLSLGNETDDARVREQARTELVRLHAFMRMRATRR